MPAAGCRVLRSFTSIAACPSSHARLTLDAEVALVAAVLIPVRSGLTVNPTKTQTGFTVNIGRTPGRWIAVGLRGVLLALALLAAVPESGPGTGLGRSHPKQPGESRRSSWFRA